MEKVTDRVRKYIIENDLEDAIKTLENSILSEKLKNNITILERNYREARDNNLLRLITHEQYRVEINNICKELLNILDHLDKNNSETHTSFNIEEYEFNQFYIGQGRVSIFTRFITINEIYRFLPKRQIKKVIKLGYFADEIYDAYEIYNFDGKLLLTIFPEENKGLDAKISSIKIHSDRFTDIYRRIFLGTTLKQVLEVHNIDEATPDISSIILSINHLSLYLEIDKQYLNEVNWWDENHNCIIISKLPNNAVISGLNIRWRN